MNANSKSQIPNRGASTHESTTGASGQKTLPRRPPFQFSLLGLMMMMFVLAAAAAPGYYLMHGRGGGGPANARLVGMLMMLAGPMLLMTVMSIFLAVMRRGR